MIYLGPGLILIHLNWPEGSRSLCKLLSPCICHIDNIISNKCPCPILDCWPNLSALSIWGYPRLRFFYQFSFFLFGKLNGLPGFGARPLSAAFVERFLGASPAKIPIPFPPPARTFPIQTYEASCIVVPGQPLTASMETSFSFVSAWTKRCVVERSCFKI